MFYNREEQRSVDLARRDKSHLPRDSSLIHPVSYPGCHGTQSREKRVYKNSSPPKARREAELAIYISGTNLYLRVIAQSHNCHSHSTLPFACEYDCRNRLCMYPFSPPFFFRFFSSLKARNSRDVATERDEADGADDRRTERTERRRPSERLAAPPRESRDVTGPPLLFAIPQANAVDARARERGPSRGPLLSASAMPFFFLARCHCRRSKLLDDSRGALSASTFPPAKFLALVRRSHGPESTVVTVLADSTNRRAPIFETNEFGFQILEKKEKNSIVNISLATLCVDNRALWHTSMLIVLPRQRLSL